MKKILPLLLISLCLACTILNTSPVLATTQPTRKPILLAWNGWNNTISWFKKIVAPKKTTNTPVVAPVTKSTIPAPAPTVTQPKIKAVTPAKPVVPTKIITPIKTPNVSKPKTLIDPPTPVTTNTLAKPTTSVLKTEPVENISATNDLQIFELNGTEADYSKSEETRANNFLSANKNKYLPDYSKLLKAYPNLNIQDVNKNGDYVGCIAKNDWDLHRAFAMIKGKFYEIGAIEGIYSCAYGINDNGQVVGVYEYKEGLRKAFSWQAGKVTKLSHLDFNDGGPERTEAFAINNNGVIIGMSRIQSPEKSGIEIDHAVRWVDGQIEDLFKDKPDINNLATDINEQNQILINSNPISIWQNGKIITVNELVPKLKEEEFVKVDEGFADEPKFEIDGSLKLRVDKWDQNIEIINGDEHRKPTISHLRYYQVTLPIDISTISIN